MSGESTYTYSDPAGLARWLMISLWVSIACLILFMAVLVLQYRFLDAVDGHAFASQTAMISAANASDNRVLWTSWLVSLISVVSLVLYMIWVYRISANAHAVGVQGLRASPAMAVISYFIPLYNFVAPPMIMSELQRASADPNNWHDRPTSWLIAVWWTLLLISGIGGLTLAFVSPNPTAGMDVLKSFTLFLVLFEIVDVAFRYVQIVLVRTVTKSQTT